MNFTTLNLEKISLCKSGKTIKLFGEAKKPLELASGRLYLPFGVSSYENKWSGMYDYSVSCYVDEQFDAFCTRLDSKVRELLSDFTTSELSDTLRQNKDFPKLFRLKLPRDSNGNFNFVVFDEDKNKIMVTEDNVNTVFCKKRPFKCIMQCEKITDWSGKSGISWILTQARYSIQEQQKAPVTETTYSEYLLE